MIFSLHIEDTVSTLFRVLLLPNWQLKIQLSDFLCGSVVNNTPANAGDVRHVGSIPGLGRSSGGGHGDPLQYSCLGNPTDRGAWWASVHRAAKIWTWLKQLSMHTCIDSHIWNVLHLKGGPLTWSMQRQSKNRWFFLMKWIPLAPHSQTLIDTSELSINISINWRLYAQRQ